LLDLGRLVLTFCRFFDMLRDICKIRLGCGLQLLVCAS
jgi:hypothetical protein